jgi:hypothetical protein
LKAIGAGDVAVSHRAQCGADATAARAADQVSVDDEEVFGEGLTVPTQMRLVLPTERDFESARRAEWAGDWICP